MSSKSKTFGILGIEYELPSFYVNQDEVAENINFDSNKIKIGLGLLEMSVPGRNEDAISLALNALYRLIRKYNIEENSVGRIEVGTESNPDASKSIKTHLLSLFSSNTSICGCDTYNACYGGTSALLNSISWLESSLWDGRYAIVICTDISSYLDLPAQPTSGGGAVAILLGEDPILKMKEGTLRHYSTNEYDFLKPHSKFPYPVLKGKESVEIYKKAFSSLINTSGVVGTSEVVGTSGVVGTSDVGTSDGTPQQQDQQYDYLVLHSPYPRLVEKVCLENNINITKVEDSLLASRRNGNSYTASLYLSLISLLSNRKLEIGERICMFSFGSGCVSSMFILEKIREGCDDYNISKRLDDRERMTYSEYSDILNNPVDSETYKAESTSGRYFLEYIEGYGRHYKRED